MNRAGSLQPKRRTRTIAVALVAAVAAFAGCGDTEDASLCTAYEELLVARAEIEAADPTTQPAATVATMADDYLDGVHRLQQAADGRYAQQLDGLEAAVNDLVLTLAAVPDDADYATWGPLVDDDLAAAADAAAQVEQAIAPSCPAAATDAPSATTP